MANKMPKINEVTNQRTLPLILAILFKDRCRWVLLQGVLQTNTFLEGDLY